MTIADDYRAYAQVYQRLAEDTKNDEDMRSCLGLADSWLRMVAEPDKVESDKFDAVERPHQDKLAPRNSSR